MKNDSLKNQKHVVLNADQRRILHLFEKGYTKRKAAEKLGMSVNVLDQKVRSIFKHLKVRTTTAAVAKAIRMGLI